MLDNFCFTTRVRDAKDEGALFECRNYWELWNPLRVAGTLNRSPVAALDKNEFDELIDSV
jgi:hypothetical protein